MTSERACDDPGVRAGDVLAGKYRVDQILGIGGMGVVVAAHHLQLDDKVAIKFMLPHALRNEEAVARFQREARAAVKLKGEHVARIIDVGTLDNGAPYMVMEHLEGCDLDAWLRGRGPLEPEQAVEFLLHACEAMAEAHSLGIVHRDLKPANLRCIRGRDGLFSVKVLDFGISKVVNLLDDDPNITRTQSLMGSPVYMSPEQLESSKYVDPRADIWSLGIVLFELIAGHAAFKADTMPQLVLKVMTDPAPSLRAEREEVPEGLDQVIRRCLEKDKEKRYATVAELAADLEPFAPARARECVERASRLIRAADPAVFRSLPPRHGDSAGSFAPWMHHDSHPSGSKWVAIAITAAVAIIMGVILLRNELEPTKRNVGSALATPSAEASDGTSVPLVSLAPPEQPSSSAVAPSSSAPSASASATSIASVPPAEKQVPRKPPVRTTKSPGYDPLDHP